MGITTARGLADKKAAIGCLFSLDLLIVKRDDFRMKEKKNLAAVALGKLGGTARAKALSGAERSEIAKQGAAARNKSLSAAERKRIAKRAVEARERKRKQRQEKGN